MFRGHSQQMGDTKADAGLKQVTNVSESSEAKTRAGSSGT